MFLFSRNCHWLAHSQQRISWCTVNTQFRFSPTPLAMWSSGLCSYARWRWTTTNLNKSLQTSDIEPRTIAVNSHYLGHTLPRNQSFSLTVNRTRSRLLFAPIRVDDLIEMHKITLTFPPSKHWQPSWRKFRDSNSITFDNPIAEFIMSCQWRTACRFSEMKVVWSK